MYDERLTDILPVAICVMSQSDVDMLGDIFEQQDIRWITGRRFSDFSHYKPGRPLVYFINRKRGMDSLTYSNKTFSEAKRSWPEYNYCTASDFVSIFKDECSNHDCEIADTIDIGDFL